MLSVKPCRSSVSSSETKGSSNELSLIFFRLYVFFSHCARLLRRIQVHRRLQHLDGLVLHCPHVRLPSSSRFYQYQASFAGENSIIGEGPSRSLTSNDGSESTLAPSTPSLTPSLRSYNQVRGIRCNSGGRRLRHGEHLPLPPPLLPR